MIITGTFPNALAASGLYDLVWCEEATQLTVEGLPWWET